MRLSQLTVWREAVKLLAVTSSTWVYPPVGRFRATASRDGEALKRDGEQVYCIQRLWGRTGNGPLEVMFGDGMWMLVDPTDLYDLADGGLP